MSVPVRAGDCPSSASRDQLRHPRPTRGGVASAGKVDAESSGSLRELGGVDLAASAEPEIAAARPAQMETPVERPIWENGTLPGIMAGMRPPRLIS